MSLAAVAFSLFLPSLAAVLTAHPHRSPFPISHTRFHNFAADVEPVSSSASEELPSAVIAPFTSTESSSSSSTLSSSLPTSTLLPDLPDNGGNTSPVPFIIAAVLLAVLCGCAIAFGIVKCRRQPHTSGRRMRPVSASPSERLRTAMVGRWFVWMRPSIPRESWQPPPPYAPRPPSYTAEDGVSHPTSDEKQENPGARVVDRPVPTSPTVTTLSTASTSDHPDHNSP
ncbi:hypothetical protein MIND_01267800 [Mycena indigotica]|uniref:Transmembrane protein n=1 Tax=Mycena indigotica TaxID=2126181 RepID=A0A8H6VTC7_9AGAR|nr:uncharacterized protein MIND_01267800 [Mycena indigotica]KAF7291241.1 hypothetical protein MIND_01267800 [Mycena indigotica]